MQTMKKITQRWIAALAACLLLAMLAPLSAAATANPYTYTVTLSVGRQGSYTGSGIQVEGSGYKIAATATGVTITGLNLGDRVAFDTGVASLGSDSKYYVKGVRLSGRDNNTVSASSFAVTGDSDYVVAYGIKGDLTQYTVNYQDTNGAALAPSRTYYGNVGDQPVVAYLYVDGYQPQSYNLTKTLVSNSAENVFTFVYKKITAKTNNNSDATSGSDSTSGSSQSEIVIVEKIPQPTAKPAARSGASSSSAASSEQNVDSNSENTDSVSESTEVVTVPESQSSAAGAGNGNGNGGNANGQNGNGDGAPQELTNIDANQSPLAAFTQRVAQAAQAVADTVTNASPIAKAGLGALLALLILLILLLVKRRRDKKKKQKTEEPKTNEK